MPQYHLCTGCKLLDLFGFYYFFCPPSFRVVVTRYELDRAVSEAERSRILLYFLKAKGS